MTAAASRRGRERGIGEVIAAHEGLTITYAQASTGMCAAAEPPVDMTLPTQVLT